MAENKTLEHLPEVRAAVAALSPEVRELLAAVQTSPFKLTAPEQFKEFAANIDYFVFEPNIHDLNDLGWRYLAQHMDMLLPPELLKAIDPVPFGEYAMLDIVFVTLTKKAVRYVKLFSNFYRKVRCLRRFRLIMYD